MEWINLFPEKILNRGFSYFCQGTVGPLTISGGFLSANVMGSQIYHVRLPLDEHRRSEFSCSCPFAQAGNLCKHMAAVLFDWEAQGSPTEDNAPVLTPRQIRSDVEQADEALLRSYLTAVLLENSKLAVQFHDLWTLWQSGMPGSQGMIH